MSDTSLIQQFDDIVELLDQTNIDFTVVARNEIAVKGFTIQHNDWSFLISDGVRPLAPVSKQYLLVFLICL